MVRKQLSKTFPVPRKEHSSGEDSTPSPPRQVHAAAHHTTSFAGLRFVFDLAHKLGLTQDLRTLTVKKRRRGIPIEDFVLGLASNFLVGGDSLSDLQVLRDETVTRELCYGLEVPAPTTAGERLRTFTLGHLQQLERILRRNAHAILARAGG